MVDLADFQRLVSDAADAGLFGVWPFRGSNSSTANLVTAMYYLPDMIHACYHVQRFNGVFPYLDQLFSNASASLLQPNHSQCLHEALTLLAEVHDLTNMSEETQHGIGRIMGQWSIMKIPTENPLVVWSSEPQPSRICSDKKEVVLWLAGALQEQRPSASDCSPAAAMQLTSALSNALAEPANAPQVCAFLPHLVNRPDVVNVCLPSPCIHTLTTFPSVQRLHQDHVITQDRRLSSGASS